MLRLDRSRLLYYFFDPYAAHTRDSSNGSSTGLAQGRREGPAIKRAHAMSQLLVTSDLVVLGTGIHSLIKVRSVAMSKRSRPAVGGRSRGFS